MCNICEDEQNIKGCNCVKFWVTELSISVDIYVIVNFCFPFVFGYGNVC